MLRILIYFFLLLLSAAMVLAQTPVIQTIQNDASHDARFCPGVRLIVTGTGFGPQRGPSQTAPAGLRVLVNGTLTPIGASDANFMRLALPLIELSPGTATFVIEYQGNRSAPSNLQLASHCPALFDTRFALSFLVQGGGIGIFSTRTASPGEVVELLAVGLGPTNPPIPAGSLIPAQPPVLTISQPRVTVAGRAVTVRQSRLLEGRISVGVYSVTFQVPLDLTPGSYPVVLGIAGFTSNSTSLPVTINGLVATQSGFTFQAVQGGGAPSPRTFQLLNGAGRSLAFTVQIATVSGGSGWLSATPISGTVDPTPPATISVSVNPSGLTPGDYYGQIRVDAPGAANSPRFLSVVLSVAAPNVNPGPVVEPTGLVFVGLTNGNSPAAQTTRITNLTSRSTSFTVTTNFLGGPSWYTATPAAGNVAPSQPVDIRVQPNLAGLATGVYRGALVLNFPQDSTSRVVDLLLVVTPQIPSTADEQDPAEPVVRLANHTCTPKRLVPVFTLLGSNFNAAVAWPTPIEVKVVDDCGAPLRSGRVIASFSNGDAAIPLVGAPGGRWSGTWTPRNARTADLKVTVKAEQPDAKLEGTAEVGGAAAANPEVPIVNTAGVVSAGSYATSATPSPGELVSVFGTKLSDGFEAASALPLRTQMQGTLLALAGRPLPLVFTSDGQVNAVIPYDIAPGQTHQLVARRGGRLSAPESITVVAAQPAVFTTDLTGKGQGHIYVNTTGAQILADAANPAVAADSLVFYCTGLGAVDPPTNAGEATPADPLRKTIGTVTITIGGRPAEVLFAGLTPGFTGLYQINVQLPAGVTPGDAVEVVVSVGGVAGPPVTIAVR